MNKKERRAQLVAEMRELNDKVLAEKRAFNADEQKSYSEKKAEVEKLTAEIDAEERAATLAGFSSEPPQPEAEQTSKRSESFLKVEKRNGQVEVRTDMTQGDASNPGGGYAVAPEKFFNELQEIIQKEALLYARVDKIPVSGAGSLGLPYEKTDASDADWTQEVPAYDLTADSSWEFGKRELNPINLNKLIKISKQLLATSAFDIDALAQRKLATKIVQAFEAGILTGTGSGQPLGIFTASNDGVPTSRDVATTGSGTGVIASDDLIEMYMKLRPAYRKNAVWIMNTAILKDVMKLKDKNGQYLWHESIRVGEPSTLLGLPVIESEFAPSAKTANSYMVVLGDLSKYKFAYWKNIEITVADQLFAGKNQIGIFGHTLADGCPCDPEAFARLKAAYVG